MSYPVRGYQKPYYEQGIYTEQTGRTKQPSEVNEKFSVAESKTVSSVLNRPGVNGLSSEEQQMIDRYFPPSPNMTLRLYGPGREQQTITPNGIGSRLDMRG